MIVEEMRALLRKTNGEVRVVGTNVTVARRRTKTFTFCAEGTTLYARRLQNTPRLFVLRALRAKEPQNALPIDHVRANV